MEITAPDTGRDSHVHMFCIRRATVMLENICSNIEILLKDPTNYDDHVCFESVLKQSVLFSLV